MVHVLVLRAVFDKVKRNQDHLGWLNDAKDVLEVNPFAGDKVSRRLTPGRYKRRFNVVYVYRYRMPEAYRLIYTLDTSRGVPSCVRVIDFLSHKEYERVFRY